MAGRLRTCAVLALAVAGVAGCGRTAAAPEPTPTPSVLRSRPLMTAIPPIVRSVRSGSCSPADDRPAAARPIGDATPPAPPAGARLTAGSGAGEVVPHVEAPGRTDWDAVAFRFVVDGCTVPYPPEQEDVPTRPLTGLRSGDRVRLFAALEGATGTSAETASAVLTVP